MAIQPKIEDLNVADFGAALEQFAEADRRWKSKADAEFRRLQSARAQIVDKADKWVTMGDVKWGVGGGVLGGGAAYVGATQGWWELTPLNVGLGVGGGAAVGVIAGRMLSKEE